MNYVVGSGPAGVSCARALLDQRLPVTMLDAGLTLEQERHQKLVQLAAAPHQDWTAENLEFLRKDMQSSASGIPLKLVYGSDYPYRTPWNATPVEFESADASASYALGGLSNVWGSAVMPYHQRDMEKWPVSSASLEDGYRAVLRFMPLSAAQDDLSAEFPLYSSHCHDMKLSRQAAQMMSRLQEHRHRLQQAGISFGKARIAVAPLGLEGPGCIYCGLCMYGCPHQLIYSSSRAVEEMKRNDLFVYRPGVIVRSVTEAGNGVRISAATSSGEELAFHASRVYLAGGLYSTTTILLRSMERYDEPVPFCDSQYFLLPLLRARGAGDVSQENLHTLAQLFLEIYDPSTSPHTIHCQLYTYNDLFRAPIEQTLGPLRPLFPMEPFLGRLLLIQGYLHSDHSASMQAVLSRTASGDVLRVRGAPSPETRATLKRLIAKMFGLSRATGSVPLPPLLKMGAPGRGFHSGGTFPMSAQPTSAQTDIYGRPAGFRRIHAVDSTVFPSIAATTITLTAMANAYRIGSLAPQYS